MYLFHCCEKLLHQFHYLSIQTKRFFGEWIQKSKQSNVKEKDAIKEAA